jgi:hypothetical protein
MPAQKSLPEVKPLWVRPSAAERIASVGKTTMALWIRTGVVKSRKVGRNRLVEVASLEELGK